MRGFEVDRVPLWQWEVAILQGYGVFRALRDNGGGTVTVDLINHDIRYVAPSGHQTGGRSVGSFEEP